MNLATQRFLESDNEEMIVIDTDVIFKPSDLEMLLSHDLPLVYGLYPLKKPGLIFPAIPLLGDGYPFAEDGRGALREVAACARGFMRIHRSVFESLIPHVDRVFAAHSSSEQYIFWKNLPGGHSEDFGFCELYRANGGKIMVDSRICCQHEGSAVYPIAGTFEPVKRVEEAA